MIGDPSICGACRLMLVELPGGPLHVGSLTAACPVEPPPLEREPVIEQQPAANPLYHSHLHAAAQPADQPSPFLPARNFTSH